jgi:hypothetical protein
MGRRIALLKIQPQKLYDLLSHLSRGDVDDLHVQLPRLPKGAKVVATSYDPFLHCLLLTLEHESFREQADGNLMSTLPDQNIVNVRGRVAKPVEPESRMGMLEP